MFSINSIGSLKTAMNINAGIAKLNVNSNNTFSVFDDSTLSFVKKKPTNIILSIGKKAFKIAFILHWIPKKAWHRCYQWIR